MGSVDTKKTESEDKNRAAPEEKKKAASEKPQKSAPEDNKLKTAWEDKKMLEGRGYKLEKEIGDGSYAVVGRYNRNKDGVKVAIKIIDRKKASKRFLKLFLPRELEISALVKHKHLIENYEWFDVGDKTFMVMELAERGNLEQYISKRGAFKEHGPKDKPRILFRQVLDAIQYLHKTVGVVHRDLKCENIFFTRDIKAKIGDFGFARQMTDSDLSNTFCGSRAYASPELLQRKEYKGRGVDMWSLGVILFNMLGARMPFDDRDIPEMIRRQQRKSIPYSKRNASSLVARDLIEHLLEPETTKRFDTDSAIAHPWLKDTPFARGMTGSVQSDTPTLTHIAGQKKLLFCC